MIDQKLLSDAQAGNIASQFDVGLYYDTDENGEANYTEAAKWYLKAANAGFAIAQNKLANLLIDGKEGVNQDIEQAIHWYTEAAKQGQSGAQYNLARQYYKGSLIERDYEKAMFWFAKAAEQGDADAYYYLGCGYYFEEGYSLNLKNGIELWEKASERGSSDASFMLGLSYYHGNGVEENNELAFAFFSKAAENGDSRALHYLGDCFRHGFGTEVALYEAIECYKKSADLDNDDGQYKLATCYDEGLGVRQDKDKAFELFHIAADNGNALAQYKLGTLYMTERNNPPSAENLIKSAEYAEMAAKQGNSNAMFLLYLICFSLEGHPWHNSQKGLMHLVEAAENGHDKAQFELGKHLLNGTDMKRDVDEGLRYITLSAETGNFDAMIYLGLQYKNGDTIQKDNKQALQWFMQATVLRPEDDLLLMEIARALTDENQFLDAIEYYKKAIELGNKVAPMMAFSLQAGCGNALLEDIPSAAYEEYLKALELYKIIPVNELDNETNKLLDHTLSDVYLNIGMLLFFERADGNPIPYLEKAAQAGKQFANILLAEIIFRNSANVEPSQRSSMLSQSFAMANSALRFHDQFTPMQCSIAFDFISGYYIHGIGGAPKDHNKAYELVSIAASQDSKFAKPAQGHLLKFRKKLFGGYEYVN